ncbi:uncharacterized protein LOC142026395 isoform X2 [Buteo buteo]|uniref:uncharacterized protein LOC142026395 isoform X2 n=1 Tax=Buteo buteo TaxID=30397 RepID=UPI003EBB80FE
MTEKQALPISSPCFLSAISTKKQLQGQRCGWRAENPLHTSAHLHIVTPLPCLFTLPGDFPPPALFPNFSSAQEGDLILARCLVFSHVPITHIFFCKNGVELANHLVGKGEFTSTLTIQLSAKTSGTYSCGYQRRSRFGQVMLSRLSIPWVLTTGGGKDDPRNGSVATSPELPFGGLGVSVSLAFAVLSLLTLALGIHLLLQIGKRVQLARLKSFIQ